MHNTDYRKIGKTTNRVISLVITAFHVVFNAPTAFLHEPAMAFVTGRRLNRAGFLPCTNLWLGRLL